MRIVSYLALALLTVLAVAVQVDGGSLRVPAWSFARGNVRIDAAPGGLADAGPIVVGGDKTPWGWTVEYDVDIPVDGEYTLHLLYSATEARPVEVFFDAVNKAKACLGVTFAPASSRRAGKLSAASSAARWETVSTKHGLVFLKTTKGVKTIKLTRRGPLPGLVALRLDTNEAFPDTWSPPKYKVRDLGDIPEKFRKAFAAPRKVDLAGLRAPVELPPKRKGKPAGSLTINACTFDRGNARIYANPDEYADFGPLAGGGPVGADNVFVEYDFEIPVSGEYTLNVKYSAAQARPVDAFLDNKNLGKCCMGVTFGSAPFENPILTTWSSRYSRCSEPIKVSLARGKHTLKFARRGPLPNLAELRLDTSEKFPGMWYPQTRKVDLSRVRPRYRNVFLPSGAVNTATLRMAIADTVRTFGDRYPGGQRYLNQLALLEKRREKVDSEGGPEELQKMHDSLTDLRGEAMLTHPTLNFGHLLFLKRPDNNHYGHTYNDQAAKTMGGSLCVLSPVSKDGKVTSLVPELEGGLFDRFDLSFDARKMIFAYKKAPVGAFRLYEIAIDPSAGKMVPGSLKQLTFASLAEARARRCDVVRKGERFFDDMDPCYLPNGKIMFTSTRGMQNVFCAAGSSVSTLYIMDADGKNVRRISQSPVNETSPCMLADGRVLYTRWEYVDKGLGNGAGIWAIHPDGTGTEHIYKNNTVWPAGMSGSREIPGTRRIVTIGGGHHFNAVGSVVLVDARRNRRTTEAMNCITPAVGYPHSMGYPSSKHGVFMDPFPFSEKFFLVSHKLAGRTDKYGIYTLDAWGNRARLYCDSEFNCFQPVPLAARIKPGRIAALEKTDKKAQNTGTLFIQDIYQGMTGIERGRVKYVRVMGALAWPWTDRNGGMGMNVDVHRKRVYGIVKVHRDGSVLFTVPAKKNIFFQALDENFMALQHMPTFINIMPGEHRSCIGCHELRRKAPGLKTRPTAITRKPQTLAPQPGDKGVRMVHYATDIQPILNKRCIACHSGEKPKGRLDLTDVLTRKYNRSYENIIGKGLVNYRDGRYGQAGFLSVPPLTHGSHRSSLVGQIRKDPCKGKLTTAEFVRIVTWIDSNVPYYGTHKGKRDPKDKDAPDFRLTPVVARE
ncbi:MAG: hypothetical protein HN350_09995 [Phycisphaerales bacterium]|jgi:hypothetical protein|nr:hypothetical protein [Phycisphaerales bacterium]